MPNFILLLLQWSLQYFNIFPRVLMEEAFMSHFHLCTIFKVTMYSYLVYVSSANSLSMHIFIVKALYLKQLPLVIINDCHDLVCRHIFIIIEIEVLQKIVIDFNNSCVRSFQPWVIDLNMMDVKPNYFLIVTERKSCT